MFQIPLAGFAAKLTLRVGGSFNASWRRESSRGDTEKSEVDKLPRFCKNADREKLNDERGDKPLPVNPGRDGAKSGQLIQERVGGSFCILSPEIGSKDLQTFHRKR